MAWLKWVIKYKEKIAFFDTHIFWCVCESDEADCLTVGDIHDAKCYLKGESQQNKLHFSDPNSLRTVVSLAIYFVSVKKTHNI